MVSKPADSARPICSSTSARFPPLVANAKRNRRAVIVPPRGRAFAVLQAPITRVAPYASLREPGRELRLRPSSIGDALAHTRCHSQPKHDVEMPLVTLTSTPESSHGTAPAPRQKRG